MVFTEEGRIRNNSPPGFVPKSRPFLIQNSPGPHGSRDDKLSFSVFLSYFVESFGSLSWTQARVVDPEKSRRAAWHKGFLRATQGLKCEKITIL